MGALMAWVWGFIGFGAGVGLTGVFALVNIDSLKYRVEYLSDLLAQEKAKSDAADCKLADIRQLLDAD